ncbi:hypothetical protein [Chryseobacterium limigenitum]|uniref:Uncharacterized protein n=1 Tax=Chryseobacterium limigenitum TaxID=1612149 RepID=A0A1K2IIR5_9FLAO|nr:hypothetical protein [Chryseobacterium limigenitum]SFZ91555.1 hypothetical protein SAMN05216324_102408 [Chryseobacterium limigenitum]
MNTQYKAPTLNKITEELEILLKKRTGGSINFRGVHYQILYASYLLLKELNHPSERKSIRMEGIEDIDLSTSQNILMDNEYIQIKSSINKMDAGDFWNLGVLQNFAETYELNPISKFKLVYNMEISKGNLHSLIHKKELSDFWMAKLKTLKYSVNYQDFLQSISYEHKTSTELFNDILILLFKNWGINKGTEFQFLRSLFYNVFVWSKDRIIVTNIDINKLFQDVKDSYSKAPVNKAFQNNWITKVSYSAIESHNSDDFYDGKAARPIHISLGLPVKRKIWQKTICDNILSSDVTVIKSSSGQGKSTLAWQTGLDLKEKNNYSIYELRNCNSFNEANSITEFLESRILIGEKPLLVIDGLNTLVEAWFEIVSRTRDLPIKYLITTRQEDWFRFGADISQVNLMTVDISLSMTEAKEIFEEFKRKRKIHPDIQKWQPVWEQIHPKGLLIEYTYLLTRGQMIQERLSTQLKYLANSRSSGAKLEILRMISLADCLNIKLKTINLINYIKSEIGFEQDRGELLNELEKEYFLNFGGNYVEGLHPVRSFHLTDLLHKNLPVEESLKNLFKIITDDYKQDFFSNIHILLTNQDKNSFYQALAEIISEDSFENIVIALDGIMHAEPKQYWLENKLKFDDAYKVGGIELFTITSTPFTELNTLNEMAEILGDKGGNFKYLSELKSELPKYQFDNSDVIIFAKALNKSLQKRSLSLDSYKGLGFLVKWYNFLKIPFNLSLIKENISIDELIKMDFQEAKEFMSFLQLRNPLVYKQFVIENKDPIFSYLKVNTDSVSIEEQNNQLQIKYLLFDKDAKHANNLSMSRIDDIYIFLPFYEKYCTEGLMLPFPSQEMISIVKQDSMKQISPEIIGNSFEVHLNQIWYAEIQKMYQESSAYSWQEGILNIRKISIEWTKNVIRIIDALLEGNQNKIKKNVTSLDQSRSILNNSIILKKKYPTFKRYNEAKPGIEGEKEINSWISSLTNINNQIFNILLPKVEHDRNLALINFKAIYFSLNDMQNAFRAIEKKTIAYFDSENICLEENKHYERLYASILYYLSQIPLENKIPVPVGRKAVEEWWLNAKNIKLDNLNNSLALIEASSNFKFVYPDQIEETDTLTYLTIGIMNFDFSDTQNVENLLFALGILRDIDYHFITIISINNNIARNGFRLKKDLISAYDNMIDGTEDIDMENLAPLPVTINEKTIRSLQGVILPELSVNKDLDKKFEILIDLWKLSEYRKFLNKDSNIEMEWLKTLQLDLIIKTNMNSVVAPSVGFLDFVHKGLEPNFLYTKEDITKEIYEQIAQNVLIENNDL